MMNKGAGTSRFPRSSCINHRLSLPWIVAALAAGVLVSTAQAGGLSGSSCSVGGCVVPAATGLVVTQFAVPVAVPQYAIPVAPQSYVQYGGGQITPAPAGNQSTLSNETAEDRIAAKILARLTSAGVIKPEALPSLVSKTCAGCHSGPQPKGGFDLSDLRALTPDAKLKAIGRVLTDDEGQRMPPAAAGKKPSPEDIGRLLQELSAVGSPAASAGQAANPQSLQPASPAPSPAERAK